MKKIRTLILATSTFALTACGLATSVMKSEPLYKISDQDTKEWISVSNAAEKCIYPQLKGLTLDEAHKQVYNKLTEVEHMSLEQIYFSLLPPIIGENATYILTSNQPSLDYLYEKYKKFNNNNSTDEFNLSKCKIIKEDFNRVKSSFNAQSNNLKGK